MSIFELEIWRKVQSGDIKAFEYIFKRYHPALIIFAVDLLHNKEQAKEIVQDILIKLWRTRHEIDINISVKSYLFRAVHNQCINFLKSQIAEKKFQADYITLFSSIEDEDQEAENFFYDGIEADILEIIENLPSHCREIFNLSRFERLRYEDIAQKLNISINTVKTQIRRALEKIRLELDIRRRARLS